MKFNFNTVLFLLILFTTVNSITASNQTTTTTSIIQQANPKATTAYPYCGFQQIDDPWTFPFQFCSLTAFTQEACENTAYYGSSGTKSSCVWWKPEKLQQIKYSAFCGHPKDGKPWEYPVMYCNEANIAMLSPKNKEECEAKEVKPTLVEHVCIWNENKGCTAENPENNANCQVYIGESNCIKGTFFSVHNKCVWHIPSSSTMTQTQSITTTTGPSVSVSQLPSPSMSSLPSFSSYPTESPSPSQSPSTKPSSMPSIVPSKTPSKVNTRKPTRPTDPPTLKPSFKPNPFPTFVIIRAPIPQVTQHPTHLAPSYLPTRFPTYSPTLSPTISTPKPSTKYPTPSPTRPPTILHSSFPSKWKSVTPTSTPSIEVSISPSRYTTKPTLFHQLPVVWPTKANTSTPVNIPATDSSIAPSKWRRPIPDVGEGKPSGSITGAILVAAGLASVAVACVGCACCCCCRRRRQVNVAFADADANNVARKMFPIEGASDQDMKHGNTLDNVV